MAGAALWQPEVQISWQARHFRKVESSYRHMSFLETSALQLCWSIPGMFLLMFREQVCRGCACLNAHV